MFAVIQSHPDAVIVSLLVLTEVISEFPWLTFFKIQNKNFAGGLFGCALKVVLPNISPVSVSGIFRGQQSMLWCSLFGVKYLWL